MSKTIFWSWQSDRNQRVTRNLIREAIVIALKRLSDDADLEDRIEIDHDTKGLAGSPDIVQSILDKIDAADVFIADITPIAMSDSGKHIANPNVLIELGYAKKSLGSDLWLTVWNTAFTDCKPEDLPFDLRGKRGPVAYSLNVNATKDEMKIARDSLVKQFVDRIGACLNCKPVSESKMSLPWLPSIENDPSIWITPCTPFIINENPGSGEKQFTEGGRWYVRILPTHFDPNELDKGVHLFPPVNTNGFSWGNTTGGLITYSGSVSATGINHMLSGATMWFRDTGEIWITHAGISFHYREREHFLGDGIAKYWVESLWYGLNKLSQNGGAGPYNIRLGVTQMEGLYWQLGDNHWGEPNRAIESSLEREFIVDGIEIENWTSKFTEVHTELRRVFSLPAANKDEIDQIMKQCR